MENTEHTRHMTTATDVGLNIYVIPCASKLVACNSESKNPTKTLVKRLKTYLDNSKEKSQLHTSNIY